MTPAPRMSCAEFEALVSPYLDGEFDADTFAALKALQASNPIAANRAQ